MPADEMQVYTASQILGHIRELMEFNKRGVMDLTGDVTDAFKAFDEAQCNTLADAQAFLWMSQHLVASVLADCRSGLELDEAAETCLQAADRYFETGVAFISSESDRQVTGFRPGKTFH